MRRRTDSRAWLGAIAIAAPAVLCPCAGCGKTDAPELVRIEAPPMRATFVTTASDASKRNAARAAARAAAEKAVSSVDAGACIVPGESSGPYSVNVSFLPSGLVIAAVTDPTSFGGGNTARCIEERMRNLMIPPFDGAGFMVNRAVYVR